MCLAVPAIVGLAGAAVSAGAAIQQGQDQKFRLDQEALNEKDAAKAHAEMIMEMVRRERGAARAAMAAGGTALDDFSTINTDEIERMGARDEAMTLLTGVRRARSLEHAGDAAYQSAKYEAIGGMIGAGGSVYGNWKSRRVSR